MNKCYMCNCNITDPDDETWVTIESFANTKTITLCVDCADFINDEIEFCKILNQEGENNEQ